ncbi:MAG: hypothetical protein J6033_04995 [Lachnospiraceae bacterium]|nr:hypothetical protein [Lachnospiraceae bacterium]
MIKNMIFAAKVSVAAVVAIAIAKVLNLDFAISAGIVAILSVAFTKKETIKTGMNRLIAFIVALFVAFLCFYTIGFDTVGFCIYMVIFIFLCKVFDWHSAMAMDSVLISHFLTFENMGFEALKNEILLFVIGVGMGVIVNLTLHKNAGYMDRLKAETDEKIKYALHRMSLRIMDVDLPDYDGSCFEKMDESIREAADIARENYMNQFSKGDVEDMEYIAMRRRQRYILFEMYKNLKEIMSVPSTAKSLSKYFEKVSEEYSRENTVKDLLEEYENLYSEMKKAPLPTDRTEFENRARLFVIMEKMREFLYIKKDYVESHKKDRS